MKIAFFDFDGTITTKDSLVDFIVFVQGLPKFILGVLCNAHYLLAWKAGFYPNDKAKEKILSHFFKGMQVEKLKEFGDEYATKQLPKIIEDSAISKIKWHQAQGDEVVVVTASSDFWLSAWCEAGGVQLISTQLEVKEGLLTGRLSTPNCYGPEKVRRIQEKYDLDQYDFVYAYGDSDGDKEMLALADQASYQCFDG